MDDDSVLTFQDVSVTQAGVGGTSTYCCFTRTLILQSKGPLTSPVVVMLYGLEALVLLLN